MSNPADSFFGESAKSAKFEVVGDTVGGPIVSIGEPRQQTDFKTGDPLTWQDGSPRMQLPVTVQTNLRDGADPNDDGKRTFYIKGEMKKAIGMALRASGAKMAVGGVLTVTFTGEVPTTGSPKKLYAATYQPPVPGAGFFDAPVQQQPVMTQPPMPVQPVQQPAAQPGMVQLTAEQYAAMQAAMAQPAQPAAPQQAAYSDYAAAMGFTPPTDQAPF